MYDLFSFLMPLALSLLILELPFEAETAWERLQLITKEIHENGTSVQPLCVNHGMRLIGTLPRAIGNPFFENLMYFLCFSIEFLVVWVRFRFLRFPSPQRDWSWWTPLSMMSCFQFLPRVRFTLLLPLLLIIIMYVLQTFLDLLCRWV